MEIKEFNIPAAWGHVAVKVWGDEKNPPVLTVHGILDNAGSFDRLIPLLPHNYCYICVDLPGHGKSTHFPPHLPIHSIDYLLVYKLVMNYFDKDKYIILGHSYGGQIGFLYAQLYPERVAGLITLDSISFFTFKPQEYGDILKSKLDNHVSMTEKLSKKEAPTYTWEEAVERIVKGRAYPLKREAAEVLVKRMLVPVSGDRYRFSMDQRLKNFINPLHDLEYALECLKYYPVKCPLLVILAAENRYHKGFFKSLIKLLMQQKNVVVEEAKGHHEVHIESPEEVAPFICSFLNRPKSKL